MNMPIVDAAPSPHDRLTICIASSGHDDVLDALSPALVRHLTGGAAVLVAGPARLDLRWRGGERQVTYDDAEVGRGDRPVRCVNVSGDLSAGLLDGIDWAIGGSARRSWHELRAADPPMAAVVAGTLSGQWGPLANVLPENVVRPGDAVEFHGVSLGAIAGAPIAWQRYLAERLAAATHVGVDGVRRPSMGARSRRDRHRRTARRTRRRRNLCAAGWSSASRLPWRRRCPTPAIASSRSSSRPGRRRGSADRRSAARWRRPTGQPGYPWSSSAGGAGMPRCWRRCDESSWTPGRERCCSSRRTCGMCAD